MAPFPNKEIGKGNSIFPERVIDFRESHGPLQNLMDAVHTGIITVDADSQTIVDVNDFAAKMIGIAKNECIGRKCHLFICPSEEGKCPVTDLDQDIDVSERILLTVDGRKIPILKSVVPISENGKKYLVESFVSIENRKRAQNSIRESEAKLTAMFQSIADPIFLMNREKRIVWTNNAALHLFGDELLGKQCCMTCHKETKQSEACHCIAMEAFQDGMTHTKDVETTDKNGDFRCFNCSSHVALRDNIDTPETVMVVARDVTKQRLAEKRILKTNENQKLLNSILRLSLEDKPLDELLEKSLELIFTSSWLSTLPKGAIFLVEDEPDILVLKAKCDLPKPLHELCAKIPFGKCLCGIAAETKTLVHTAHIDERHVIHCPGIPHGHYNIPILDHGNVLGVVDLYLEAGHERDEEEITFLQTVAQTLASLIRRKQFEKELRQRNGELSNLYSRLRENQRQLIQSEKMASIGQLAAGVAHEINNPIGFVMSNLRTLAEYVNTIISLLKTHDQCLDAISSNDLNGKERLEKKIQEIREKEDMAFIFEDITQLLAESLDGTERVNEIVKDLKSFARLDESEVKEADINECIESTLKIVWNELKYKCEVRKDLTPLPLTRCYPQQLNQVFMNMLVNAAHAIPEQGVITITSGIEEDRIAVKFSDTGVGIPPENLSKLFDPFFTTKEIGKGTGLGLSISHGIVEKHGGEIKVESVVGKGTTFTIFLPVDGIQ